MNGHHRSRVWVKVCVLAVCLGVACTSRDDISSFIPKDARLVGSVLTLDVGDVDWLFRPYAREDGGICVAFSLPTGGGGHCFVAGWVVETHAEQAAGRSVMIGVAVPEAIRVVIPGSFGTFAVQPDRLFGGKKWFVRSVEHVPEGADRNAIAAFGVGGEKLGNEHWNVGTVQCPWAGPWDGMMDLVNAEPRPACLG